MQFCSVLYRVKKVQFSNNATLPGDFHLIICLAGTNMLDEQRKLKYRTHNYPNAQQIGQNSRLI